MKPSPQFLVYMLGVALLALSYGPVSSALGGQWLFLVCAIAYLLGLRLLGSLVAKALAAKKSSHDA